MSDKDITSFLDDGYACKICDGELPDGHQDDCCVYGQEKRITDQAAEIEQYKKEQIQYDKVITDQVNENFDQAAEIEKLEKSKAYLIEKLHRMRTLTDFLAFTPPSGTEQYGYNSISTDTQVSPGEQG